MTYKCQTCGMIVKQLYCSWVFTKRTCNCEKCEFGSSQAGVSGPSASVRLHVQGSIKSSRPRPPKKNQK